MIIWYIYVDDTSFVVQICIWDWEREICVLLPLVFCVCCFDPCSSYLIPGSACLSVESLDVSYEWSKMEEWMGGHLGGSGEKVKSGNWNALLWIEHDGYIWAKRNRHVCFMDIVDTDTDRLTLLIAK